MDKIVRRVTVVERGGDHRETKVVYDNDRDDDEDDDGPNLHPLERRVRSFLKSQVISAQEAYQQHLNSASKGGNAWLYDVPRNLMRARKKSMREMERSSPFKNPDIDEED